MFMSFLVLIKSTYKWWWCSFLTLIFLDLCFQFNKNGSLVFFDENGDAIAQYDFDIVTLGQYDTSFTGEEPKFIDNVKILWGGNHNEVK